MTRRNRVTISWAIAAMQCLVAGIVLAFQGASPGDEFVLVTIDGPLEPATIDDLREDWSIRVGGKSYPGDRWLTLQRRNAKLPAVPAPPYLRLTTGDVIPLTPLSPLRFEDEKLFFLPATASDAGARTEWSVPIPFLSLLCLSLPEGLGDADVFFAKLQSGARAKDLVMLKNPGVFVVKAGERIIETPAASIAAFVPNTEFQSRPRTTAAYAHVALAEGARLHFRSLLRDKGTLIGKTLTGMSLQVPIAQVAWIDLRQKQATYLSQMKPLKETFTPFLGIHWPVGGDVDPQGRPLRLRGEWYDKGLGVHPRTEIAYSLDAKYRWFEALVGIDDRAGPRSEAAISVLVDGTPHPEATARAIRANTLPIPLRIDVRKARVLTLMTDFGAFGDVRANVAWAGARLIKD